MKDILGFFKNGLSMILNFLSSFCYVDFQNCWLGITIDPLEALGGDEEP